MTAESVALTGPDLSFSALIKKRSGVVTCKETLTFNAIDRFLLYGQTHQLEDIFSFFCITSFVAYYIFVGDVLREFCIHIDNNNMQSFYFHCLFVLNLKLKY